VFDHPALRAFAPLPLQERLFVRARLFSAPLVEIARRVKGPRVLDVGCGHGLLCALLAWDAPERRVTGIDPDPRKIAWAQASVGREEGVRFEVATADQLAAREAGTFDTVTIADVLYLLPEEAQGELLAATYRLLKPGGLLLLKEAEDDGGWRTTKALLQERLMVRILGRTRSSGGLGFRARSDKRSMLEHAGFEIDEVLALSRWSTTPHVLFAASRSARPG